MVQRLQNGDYEVNGIAVKKEDAWEIFNYVQFENHKEDVLTRFKDGVEAGSYDESLLNDDDFIETAARYYENAIENDDSWNYQVDDSIDETLKEWAKKEKPKAIDRGE